MLPLFLILRGFFCSCIIMNNFGRFLLEKKVQSIKIYQSNQDNKKKRSAQEIRSVHKCAKKLHKTVLHFDLISIGIWIWTHFNIFPYSNPSNK